VLFDRHDRVAQHGRTAGPGDGEQVREASRCEAEIGPPARCPHVGKPDTLPAPDVDGEQGAVIASKPVARTRSLDDHVDLAADELGDRVVGCHVEPEVRIRAPQRNQAPLCPRGLEHSTAFKYEEFRSLIRIESALAIMSGHTGVDFSTLDLDDNVADVDAQGIRGLFDAILRRTTASP
jgi:hypothetical protein